MQHIPKQSREETLWLSLTFWPSALCCNLDWGHWKSERRNRCAHKVLTHIDRVRLCSCSDENNHVTHLYNSSEPVQTVANCDVDGLPEYSVAPL